MILLGDIINAYLTGRDNNRVSPDQVEFELHWQARCNRLYEQIVAISLRPTAYTFVATHPAPREIFASDMDTRVLHYYLDIRLRPLLEKRMSMHTFNNRVGMGTSACQNAVASDIYEVSRGFTKDCWVIKIDFAGCFPNINQDIAYSQLRSLIEEDYWGVDKEELLLILQVCIFSYPTHHCYRKSPLEMWNMIPKSKSLFTKPDGIGAAIGHLIWQNAVNYYFNDIDLWLESLGIKAERYVDDYYLVVSSKTALLLIPEMRRRVEKLGARLHPKKFYCQHYTKGVECLGMHIKMDRIYPNSRPINRAILKVREFNKRIRPQDIDRLLSSLNSYFGLCKNSNGYNQAMRILREMNPKWFKYVHFNSHRVCLQANDGYKKRQRIIKQHHLS